MSTDVISEITRLTEKDCYHLVERHKKQHTYPMHRHGEMEINFVENCQGNRRVVGDSIDKDTVYQEETIADGISDESVSDETAIGNEQVSDKSNDVGIQSKEEPKRVENTPSNKIDTPVKSSDKEEVKTPKIIDASASQQTSINSSLEETALDVIRGLYGNGEERKQKLGDSYRTIQNIVNDMYRKGLVK